MNDITNLAFYASVAIFIYLGCYAVSPNAGRGWISLCGGALGGFVSFGVWAWLFLRKDLGLFGLAFYLFLIFVTIGAISAFGLTARLIEPRK